MKTAFASFLVVAHCFLGFLQTTVLGNIDGNNDANNNSNSNLRGPGGEGGRRELWRLWKLVGLDFDAELCPGQDPCPNGDLGQGTVMHRDGGGRGEGVALCTQHCVTQFQGAIALALGRQKCGHCPCLNCNNDSD
jgi:hypothetical protein